MTAPLSIALADDQALIRSALAALLHELGIDVAVQAEDGHALLEALHRQRVDVVVSDIRMPRLSGIDAVARLRERADPTPVLLLTTFDDPALMAAARRAGGKAGDRIGERPPCRRRHAVRRDLDGRRTGTARAGRRAVRAPDRTREGCAAPRGGRLFEQGDRSRAGDQ